MAASTGWDEGGQGGGVDGAGARDSDAQLLLRLGYGRGVERGTHYGVHLEDCFMEAVVGPRGDGVGWRGVVHRWMGS